MSPLPAFADAAAGVGFLNWLPDNDRVVRRVPLVLNIGGRLAPSLRDGGAAGRAGRLQLHPEIVERAAAKPASAPTTGMVALQNGDAVDPRPDSRGDFFESTSPATARASERRRGNCCEPGADLSKASPARWCSSASAGNCCSTSSRPRSRRRPPGVVAARRGRRADPDGRPPDSGRTGRPARNSSSRRARSRPSLAVALPFLLDRSAGALIGMVATAASPARRAGGRSRGYGLIFDPLVPLARRRARCTS